MNRREKRRMKFEEEKRLRKLYREFIDTLPWRNRDNPAAGCYVDVEPYRVGWERSFTLRPDIKNRKDAHVIEQALDLINNREFCRRKDFVTKDYKTGKLKPMKQELNYLTVEKWEKQPDYIKKWFYKGIYRDKYNKNVYEVYYFHFPWYFVFKIEPRIVTQQWVPNEAWATRHAEVSHKIDRENLWPQIDKMLGISRSRYYREWNNPYIDYKYGKDDADYEYDE